jgi:hypothetical protein
MIRRSLFVLFVLASAPSLFALGNLLQGDFESPAVQSRATVAQGGDPTSGKSDRPWIFLRVLPKKTGTNGSISTGLTNEIARGGSQSFFVEFDHVKTPYQSATLTSNLFPIVSGSEYQIGIWGRTDAKNPVTGDARPAYLKLEADFFGADGNTSIGDPFYSIIALYSQQDHKPSFPADDWQQFFGRVTPPAGAVFVQVKWIAETAGNEPGELNTTLFLDDATILGEPNPIPNLTPSPVEEPSPAPDASADTTGSSATTGTSAQ